MFPVPRICPSRTLRQNFPLSRWRSRRTGWLCRRDLNSNTDRETLQVIQKYLCCLLFWWHRVCCREERWGRDPAAEDVSAVPQQDVPAVRHQGAAEEPGEAGDCAGPVSPESLLVLGTVRSSPAGGEGGHSHRDRAAACGQPEEELWEGTQRAGGRPEDPDRTQTAGGRQSLRQAVQQEQEHLGGSDQQLRGALQT